MMKRRSFLPLQRCLNGAKIRSMKICISFWGQEARNLNTTARLTPTPARPPLPVPVSLCILPYKSLGIRNKTACVTYIQSESVKVNIGRVEVPNVGSSAEKKEQNLHQAVKYTSLTKSKTLRSLLRKYSATNLMSTGISPSR